ncbi:MAG: cation:proton antiporter [Streptosporangiaceae bacterium]|nr:cation:proton antiporter [Streptosporangiaceae bacterium]
MFPVDLLLLELVVILAAARLFGEISSRLGQPPVIGEIVAGIALGPTLLGLMVGHRLFPPVMLPSLSTVADIGLALYMFVVGMELDRELVQDKMRVAAGVATGATLLPFAVGCGVAFWLAPRYALGGKLSFVLFFAVSVSATAFPVLARILTDRHMERSLLGGLSLAAAAVIDVVSYALLAVVVAIVSAAGHDSWRLILVPVYFLMMIFLVRPLLLKVAVVFDRNGRMTPRLCGVLIGLFFSAWAAQWLQINFIFGAFLFGAVMPRSEGIIRHVRSNLDSAVHLMLPVFFVVTGLTVNLSKLHLNDLGILVVILAVAIFGKLGGGYAGARLTGIPRQGSAVMASLVNTRGLTELVVLSVGLQEHIIGPELYALLIVMALVTTAMTGPLLNWFVPRAFVDQPDVPSDVPTAPVVKKSL